MIHVDTHLTSKQIDELVALLNALPPSTGISLSRPMQPPHTPLVINGWQAIIALPGNFRGNGEGNNPCEALRLAWSRAHVEAAAVIHPQSVQADHAALGRLWQAVKHGGMLDENMVEEAEIGVLPHVQVTLPKAAYDEIVKACGEIGGRPNQDQA